MTTEFYLLFGFILAGFAGIFWLLARKKEPPKNQSENLFLMLQNQINDITRTLDSRLAESTRLLQGQFGTSTKIIQEVTEKLVKLDETNRQVVNFADQLRNLQDILKNPKQRGILGEYYLETVLKNVMPPGSYQ